jgi:hypothetical protein
MLGDHGKAARLQREGLRMAEELGLWSEVSVRLAWLAWIAVRQCDYQQAWDLGREARRLAGEQGYRVGEIFAEVCLAFASRRRGDLEGAERYLTTLLHAAGRQQEGMPPPLHLPMVLTELGFLAEQRGQWAEARRLHLEGFAAARTLGEQRMVALAMEGLAGASDRPDSTPHRHVCSESPTPSGGRPPCRRLPPYTLRSTGSPQWHDAPWANPRSTPPTSMGQC